MLRKICCNKYSTQIESHSKTKMLAMHCGDVSYMAKAVWCLTLQMNDFAKSLS